MNLLLDTNALLWCLGGQSRLGAEARRRITDPGNDVWVSAASAWEIAIKAALGRLDLDGRPRDILPREIDRAGFAPLPITIDHALAVGGLPRHHSDPFDRVLIAQAIVEGLTIVTSDRAFADYQVPILAADF